jgi:ribosome biogenesis protein ERB1
MPDRNTVGDVPLEWYKDEEHIGYDTAGKKLKKKERRDQLDSFLARTDDANDWRKIYDEYNDEEVELTKEEVDMIRRIRQGKIPHAEVNPYEVNSITAFGWSKVRFHIPQVYLPAFIFQQCNSLV